MLSSKTGRANGERLESVQNESGKYRNEASHSAAQTPIAETALYDSSLRPCVGFGIHGARLRVPPAALPIPRGGPAFPVCRRRNRLVWRRWGGRIGARAFVRDLRLLLRRAFLLARHLTW